MTDSLAGTAFEGSRFRAATEWFVAGEYEGARVFEVGATAERTADLLYALSVHLDPAVDVRIVVSRTGRGWQGALLALPEVRAELGRLRQALAGYGGVEVAVFSPTDQLTLTPALQLVIYARTDRWAYLLAGLGLEERAEAPARVWDPAAVPRAPLPPLEAALEITAQRLGLVEFHA